ncbi:MAG: protein kinase [Nannocystis sp.]|nr:protein kinase [Nannocystis sp.]
MSRVYSGHHMQTGVRVAIKLIDPALSRDPAIKQRLLGEARAMMELQSNHIVRALDVGALPSGQLYVIMDYLGGENLDALLTREGPLPWARVAAIGLQICDGLATAHRGGIIHRDIKPQNCFRTTIDDTQEHIKIIDFGVAREIRIDAGLTEQGVLPGTSEYMAPELVKRGVRANERSDIYAVGVTLYKLLTGHVPFQGATYMETLRRHVDEPLVLPSLAAPDRGIPREVDELIACALTKNPEERFSNAGELARTLRAILERPPHTTLASSSSDGPGKHASTGRPGQQGLASSMLLPVGPRRAQPDDARVQDPPRAAPRTLDSRFVLLRMTTLMAVSALFMVGTFVIRPRAEASPKSPTAAEEPSAALIAAKTDRLPSSPPAAARAMASEPTAKARTHAPTSISATPPTDTKQPPIESPPGDLAAPETPVVEPDGLGPPIADDPLIVVDPEQPPEPIAPAESAATPEPTVPPERNFGYTGARKLVEEQHVYLRNECMGKKAKKPLARLKFRADVRSDGRPALSVFSGEKAVRSCVRDLFKFPFDSSPRGGAFEYTLTMTTASLKPVAVDPEKVN